jgi:alpha-glucosidase
MNKLQVQRIFLIVITLMVLSGFGYSENETNRVVSPDGSITAKFRITNSLSQFDLFFKDRSVLLNNRLGLIGEDEDFSTDMDLVSVSEVKRIEDNYVLINGKKRNCAYSANQKIFHLKNSKGKELDIIFQVSDHGVAFRYFFPGKSDEFKHITDESTSFGFEADTRAWIQPIAVVKSGWSSCNPSFEEFYLQRRIKELPDHKPGWTLPALFQSGKFWISITESASDHDYCGGRLKYDSSKGLLKIGFPQQGEVHSGNALIPESRLPWYSPWRIITIGDNLGTIIESTLGTDLARPNVLNDISYIKPGRSSWSWVLFKDDSTIYPVQKRFIDYAADMKWEYCLIDADWDRKIGYEKLGQLCSYAKSKGVGITVWYNSAGDWNTTPYTPRDKMLTKESRDNEFKKLKELGVSCVKIDFFGGEGQSVMSYYQDILADAASHGLMIDFHGCTYPRGLQRTYPNLMTMEGIKGFEFVTFDQPDADNEPVHSTIIPFTRNLFDPMDFTPVCFSELSNVKRRTTNSFELALSVLFQSGIQHFAEVPEGMAKVPMEVKELLSEVPAAWDETKFVDGYPGKFVVIARRKNNTWYIAGINGENSEKILNLNLEFAGKMADGILFSSGENDRTIKINNEKFKTLVDLKVTLNSRDGFLLKLIPK